MKQLGGSSEMGLFSELLSHGLFPVLLLLQEAKIISVSWFTSAKPPINDSLQPINMLVEFLCSPYWFLMSDQLPCLRLILAIFSFFQATTRFSGFFPVMHLSSFPSFLPFLLKLSKLLLLHLLHGSPRV